MKIIVDLTMVITKLEGEDVLVSAIKYELNGVFYPVIKRYKPSFVRISSNWSVNSERKSVK